MYRAVDSESESTVRPPLNLVAVKRTKVNMVYRRKLDSRNLAWKRGRQLHDSRLNVFLFCVAQNGQCNIKKKESNVFYFRKMYNET